MGLDAIFPGSQVNGGIIIAIVIAILMYILMTKTTLGYQLKACGSNRHAARYAGIRDKRNIVLSMAIAGALSAGGAALYYLSGNTEFAWQTYQSLPDTGFNGIPVALLAACNPIGVIFTGIFMSMLRRRGHAAHRAHALQRVHHRRRHCHHRVPERLLAGHKDAHLRRQKAQKGQGRPGRGGKGGSSAGGRES